MTTFSAFLEKRFQTLLKENDIAVLASIASRDKDLLKRIENFRKEKMTEEERLANTVDSILETMKTYAPLRAQFRKDATRQTIHEKAQIEWLQTHKYPDLVKLSADTNGACLSSHRLHKITKSSPRPSDATKTFDGWIPSTKTYLTLKYTSMAGGAQDNQFRDVKHFVSEIVGYLTDVGTAEETFDFYLDGKYYTAKKIAELQAMIPVSLTSRIHLTCCEAIAAAVD